MRSQDTLVMINGIRTVVTVLEIGTETVRYKKTNNLTGPECVTSKKDIKKIILRDGSVEQVQLLKPNEYVISDPALYKKGVADANIHYKGPYGAVSTGITSFLTLPGGLIPAVIISATPPSDKNLAYPDAELWKDKSYQAGYRHRAKKIKQRNVWGGFGIGFCAGIIAILTINSVKE